ncbi:right-handed parallel beta-helix repeat-containing protein [PVC group bacterium]|nr:right-handed parallel beta-helix repeat-containing protein [PVC group bacterium]
MEDWVIESTSPLEVMHATTPVLTGNRFVRNVHRGVMLIACERALVRGNHFDGCAPNRPMLILLTSRNCRILENRFFGANRCIGLTIGGRSHTNRAVANSFFNCLFGIEFSGGKNPRNMLLGNLMFNPRYSGIRMRKCGERTLMRNCVVWGARRAGLEIEEAAGLAVENCVFAKCAQSAILPDAEAAIEFRHNCFWQNGPDKAERPRGLRDGSTNVQTDPMFVDPEAGNFRLMTKAFGHPQDSPLLRAGAPGGTSIGLYPWGIRR